MKPYIETTVTDFAKNAMSDYIEETVTNRAIPAFQDGLKPVQRKILWAMYKMGLFYNLSHKKSAKVTGEVIAKYNPHGDSSAYMAMGNMAQAFQKYNFIDGQGNWGAWSGELPAASRYTECRLSELAQTCLLDKDYLKVVPMVDNYDGTEKEPVYLPARLPFILLLNISGIATAVRTGLPSFDLKALAEVCIDYLKTGKMKTDEIIPITTINGGKCISTKEEQLEFYKTGSGVLKFQPSYIMGKDRMIITGVQDDFNFEKVSDNLLDLPEIKSVKDEGSTEIKIGVYFKGNLDQKALDKIISKTQTKCIYSTNILINKVNEENVPKAKYKETNIYSLIKNWCKFRVG